MIGNLTIDKASMNISYFLNTIRIIYLNGGRISRNNFVQEMADFIGTVACKNGKENRTPYNKSKLPRYFGFVDIETEKNGISYLVLTHRGQKLFEYISEDPTAASLQRYYINPNYREAFIDLIFESVIFDSFGKNNCGAEQSNTDVEPPKIVFKTIQELGRATAEEIYYIIFGLNKGEFKTFDEAIAKIRSNREHFHYDYSNVMEEWKLTNIVGDCKIINIFTDDNIKLLQSERDKEVEKLFYYISPHLSQRHLNQIKAINAIYQPLRLFVYTDGNDITIRDWVDNAVLGCVSDNSFVFQYYNGDPLYGRNGGNGFVPGLFEKALLKAFKYPKKNVYLILNHIKENQIPHLLGKYYPLLKRIDDLASAFHGWSDGYIEDEEVFAYLDKNLQTNEKVLRNNRVRIPSNIQMVGTVIMDNTTENIDFNYKFTRALVKTSDTFVQEVFEDKRITNGTNTILYGVPGSGKSWTIEHEYCKSDSIVERVVFHPDYTNADFIGQILPIVDADKQVSYEFTPGPFTSIVREAYRNPKREYILIIEEMNRGNAAAIFGDVFQLLDRAIEPKNENGVTYPVGTSEYGITNKYMAEYIYGDASHKVRIPSNLSIIGTMNTSDQNVFTLDTAFQRRWKLRLIENSFKKAPKSLVDAVILDTKVTWKTFCEIINRIIIGNKAKMASAEDKRLGVYFIQEEDLTFKKAVPSEGYDSLSDEYESLSVKQVEGATTEEEDKRLASIIEIRMHNSVFAEKVLKYLWDDAFKFNLEALFDTEQYQSLEQVILTFANSTGMDRFKIFKKTVQDSLYQNVKE